MRTRADRQRRRPPGLPFLAVLATTLAVTLAAASVAGAQATVYEATPTPGTLRDGFLTQPGRTVAQACHEAVGRARCSWDELIRYCRDKTLTQSQCEYHATALAEQPPGFGPGYQPTTTLPPVAAQPTPTPRADPGAGGRLRSRLSERTDPPSRPTPSAVGERGPPVPAPAHGSEGAPLTGIGGARGAVAGSADPFTALGGRSPRCGRAGAGTVAARCQASGSPASPYPIDRYGWDLRIDHTGPDFLEGFLPWVLETIASFCWMALLYAFRGMLLAVDWGLNLNLVAAGLGPMGGGMSSLYTYFGLDSDWFSLALSAACLWGLWVGLVQGKHVKTFAGLAAMVGLMLVALLVIHRPDGTVGRVGGWADRGSQEVVTAIANAGTADSTPGAHAVDPRSDGIDRGSQGLFNVLVLRPWCALEFTSVDFCLGKPPAEDRYYDEVDSDLRRAAHTAPTVADLWLRYEADGEEREQLYESWKHKEGKQRPLTERHVRTMSKDAMFARLAVFAVVVAGLLGALLLFGWIVYRLLGFALLALFYLLLAAVTLLLPAFGDAGRRGFLGWLRRLGGALLAKLPYAILLGIAIYEAVVVSSMGPRLGWFGVWILQTAFWWLAFVYRHQLLDWLTFQSGAADPSPGADGKGGSGRASLYWRARAAQMLASPITWAASRAGRRAVHTAARQQTIRALAHREAARDQLAHHAERALNQRYDAAQERLKQRRTKTNELRVVEGALRADDQARALEQAQRQAGIDPDGRAAQRQETQDELRAVEGALRGDDQARALEQAQRQAGIDPERRAQDRRDMKNELTGVESALRASDEAWARIGAGDWGVAPPLDPQVEHHLQDRRDDLQRELETSVGDGRRLEPEERHQLHARREELRRRLARLGGGDASGRGDAQPATLDPAERRQLQTRREHLQREIDSPDMRQAEALVRHADSNQATHGRRWTDEDVDRWIEQRRNDLDSGHVLPPDLELRRQGRDPDREPTEAHLEAAGINRQDYEAADPQQRAAYRQRARRAAQIQRDLLRAVPGDGGLASAGTHSITEVRRHVHPAQWRAARRRARRAEHEERWRERTRRNLYRGGRR